jgi:hypothetical protein
MKTFTLQQIKATATKRPPGYIEDVLSFGAVEGDKVTLTDESYNLLVAKYRTAGPGTELTKIIAWIGLTPAPGCKCKKRARYMDKMGCDWCEENISQIIGWLQEEHARTKSLLPFISFAAEKLVRLAIRRARQGNSQ